MMKEEHVFIKSHLTYRGRSKTTRNKLVGRLLGPLSPSDVTSCDQYYVVFGKYTATSYHSGRYFLRMFGRSDEKSLQDSINFKKNEFCGLEVGSIKKTTRWKLWEKERHQTFLRLFFTAKDTVEFFIDNEDPNPLQAFRTIEAWRKKLTKELGYRCYWNVYMRPCGQEWGEGYGKLHLTEKTLAIVSTEKRPQTLGHWYLKSALMCKYVGSKRLIIRFEELDEPLVFETEDAQEIARTLSMNMTGLADKPVYDPFPKQEEPPISKHRKSVSNRHKPAIVYSSDEDDTDGQYGAEAGNVTPNTPVPVSPVVMVSPVKTKQGSEFVSPKQLKECERKYKKLNSPPASSPNSSIHNNEYPPDYEAAALVHPAVLMNSAQQNGISGTYLTNGENDKNRPNQVPNGFHHQPRPNLHLHIPHPEPPPEPSPSIAPRPVPSPRLINVQPPERPPRSPMLPRTAHTPQPPTSAREVVDKFVYNNGHPQQPATPPPRPGERRPEELQAATLPPPRQPVRRAEEQLAVTLPRRTDMRHVEPPSTPPRQPDRRAEEQLAVTLPRRTDLRHVEPARTQLQTDQWRSPMTPLMHKKPVAAPRQKDALSRLKSKSMDNLSSIMWDADDNDNDYDVNQDLMGGGGLVPIDRKRNSRKTMKKKQPTWKRPISSYSDDDVKDEDKEEIYDVSNILNHLSNRRDDRSFRISTMWYVNILSGYDKPPPLEPFDPSYDAETPPPLPPRDAPQPVPRKVPITTDEYWSAMIICHTLRKALVKDPPLPDTLKLSVGLRNKVCMMLYMNNLGTKDWRDLADIIGLEYQAVELIEAFTVHHNHETSAEIVLRHWQFCYNRYPYDREKCPRACDRTELVKILTEMHRNDIVKVIKDNKDNRT